MAEYLRKIFTQILGFMGELSPGKKIAVGLTAVGIGLAISALFMWAGDKIYQPLMTNLTTEDSASIIRVLRERKIPFKVENGGKTIAIPPEDIHHLRLELATMGLPQSGVIGYEVFDAQKLGTTSFVQRVNQKRALEGELMRTISTIKGVKRSRVHLALPKKSVFIEDQKKPSASVVLDLDNGVRLTEKQIYGIGNLVSSAVEGLGVPDVVIVDATGKVLSKNSGDPMMALAATQLDYRQKVENDLKSRVEALLGRIVGEGRAVATISAELNFSHVSEVQTIYDGDSAAVRSTQIRGDDQNQFRPSRYGIAGAQSNQPGEQPAGNVGTRTNTRRKNEVVNYAIPKTIRNVSKPVGEVKKLSVAVVIDGKQVRTKDENGVVMTKVEPWSPEKLKEFEGIVASALGINPKRGDILQVKNMEFSHEDFEAAEMLLAESERRAYFRNMITYAVVGLLIILFFLFVVRPFIKWVTENTIDSVDTYLPQTIEELEKLQSNSSLPGLEEAVPVLPEKVDPEKVEGEMIKEKIITLVDANPHKAALVLKDWMVGEFPTAKDAEGEPGAGDQAGSA